MVDKEPVDALQADDANACQCSTTSDCSRVHTRRFTGTDRPTVIDEDRNNAAKSSDAITGVNSNDESNQSFDPSDQLRDIVIDGSNIAMSHGNRQTFSCRGIKLAVEWFQQRGHKKITVFVPQWRRETHKQECTVTDPQILTELELEKIVVFTPSRKIGGKRIVCYDDRYIVKLAAVSDGIIVSNDTFRDLAAESQEFRRVIEDRLLMYSFAKDRFMPPFDPLGRDGPSLDDFLRKESTASPELQAQVQICPYVKCTYGAKCRYYHPARRNRRGDKLSGTTVEKTDLPANSTTHYEKKKICRTGPQRSYEKQQSENNHSDLKPFHSDPTNSKCCLALAMKLSDEFKTKSGHTAPDQNNDKRAKGNPSTSKPEQLHKKLGRQLAIQGADDLRTANLAQAYNASCTVERSCPDNDSKYVDLPDTCTIQTAMNYGSALCTGNSFTDSVAQAQLETNPVSFIRPEHLPGPLFCGHQPFILPGRTNQDHLSATVITPQLLALNGAYMDLYRPIVRPVVLAHDCSADLHSRRFQTPQFASGICISPTWPQIFPCHSRSYHPQNELMRPFIPTTR